MKDTKFGFIGCGNMGGALALALAKTTDGSQIALCDADRNRSASLATLCKAKTGESTEIAQTCQYIFLGVKPQSLDALFSEIRPDLQKRKTPFVLVSMAAGVTVSSICKMAGVDCAVIRIMPNTPVSVGEGMILYTANEKVTKEQLDIFIRALSAAGRLDMLAEEKIDAASALSGCGPAFVCLFAEALADGAVECGLAREQARLYAAQTLLGTAKLILESGKHTGELKDAVCSPGGTTIAGVHALEEGAFRASAMNAVTAAYEKTLQLKK